MIGESPPELDDNQRDLIGLTDVVEAMVDTMRRGRIDRLVVTRGDFHLELEAGGQPDKRTRSHSPDEQPLDPDEPELVDENGKHIITSPMIGTFYTSPAPGEPPFVRVGDSVAQGDTIGIVEAMKIMNEIAADRSGEVTEILAANGETVEYGSPLVRMKIRS